VTADQNGVSGPARIDDRDRLVFVAQTPFHYFMATIVAPTHGPQVDLWLVDRLLRPQVDSARASGLWRDVSYIERTVRDDWYAPESARSRAMRFRGLRRRIDTYLAARRPGGVVIFSDNHEVTAAFAECAHRRGIAVALAEEGVGVYGSPWSTRAPTIKGVVRTILGIPNPWGRNLGWAPWPDALLISRPAAASSDYVRGRRTIAWPAGPFPDAIVHQFLASWVGGGTPPWSGEVDVVMLGQPLPESRVVSQEWEAKVLRQVGDVDERYRVLVKPHPFDRPDKYGALRNVLPVDSVWGSLPAEVVLHITSPKLVITFGSSAAVSYVTRYAGRAVFVVPSTDADAVMAPGLRADLRQFPNAQVTTDIEGLATTVELLLGRPSDPRPAPAPRPEWQERLRDALWAPRR
jgi:hypothetical protein